MNTDEIRRLMVIMADYADTMEIDRPDDPGVDHMECVEAMIELDGIPAVDFAIICVFFIVILSGYVEQERLDFVPFNHVSADVDMNLYGDWVRTLVDMLNEDTDGDRYDDMIQLCLAAPPEYGAILIHGIIHLAGAYGTEGWRRVIEAEG